MKKLLLSLCLVVTALAARANSVTIQNLLTIPITVYFVGVNPDGTTFSSAYVSLMPGLMPTVFTDPTTIPGVTGAWTTGRVTAFFGVCNPYDLALGSPNLSGPNFSQHVGNLNTCYGGVEFDMYWNEPNAVPYNAFITIF